MDPSQIEKVQLSPSEVLARYHRAMLDKSADDLADLYSVDAIHEFPMLFPGMPESYHGREEIRAGYRAAWAALPARVEEIGDVVLHQTADPEVIIVEQRVGCVLTATGRPFAANNLLVIRVHDGLITHVRDYLDALTLNQALNRLPAVLTLLAGDDAR
ncbi:nuclear transport factor 2 family protein [Plantactinospora solaniradicis]|uniref:Nuclear transport factor 2 family protein n=1 Tax=Plantactinospora solaniradicis TaxID=1723736 RepID=A0ABW1KLW9_9ACTN